MIKAEVISQNAAQMFFVEHDHVIEALPPNTADQPLRVAILPTLRGVICNSAMPISLSCHEMLAADSVTIANHEAWPRCFRNASMSCAVRPREQLGAQ